MAAQKTVAPSGATAYSLIDAHAGRTVIQPSNVKNAISIGQMSGAQVHLSQQNVIDLLPTLTAFAASGVLT